MGALAFPVAVALVWFRRRALGKGWKKRTIEWVMGCGGCSAYSHFEAKVIVTFLICCLFRCGKMFMMRISNGIPYPKYMGNAGIFK